MRAAARETTAAARENGVPLDKEETEERALEVARSTAENESSMFQDLRAGRRTEIDALNGYVVEKSEETPTPVNETLAALVRSTLRSTEDRTK